MTAEQFIKDYTNHCSNELADGGFHEWLTPEQALRAVEIAKDAFIEKAKNWLYLQLNEINMEGEDMENFLEDFKTYMKGE